MEKKTYTSPSVAYLGPDISECKEVNAPLIAAVTGVTLVYQSTHIMW